MDDWDPRVTNGLAAQREIILFDNVGVASSSGETPSTVAAMEKDCVDFCNALNLKKIDVLGFSLGGMIAQQLAFQHPDMIRRMILVGTGPRGGEGMTFTELSAEEQNDPLALLMNAFFTPSGSSQAAGRAYVERLQLRKTDRDAAVSQKAAAAQLKRSENGEPYHQPTATRCCPVLVSPLSSCMEVRTSLSFPSMPSSWDNICPMPSLSCIQTQVTERHRNMLTFFSITRTYS